jgi:hypothetical protein
LLGARLYEPQRDVMIQSDTFYFNGFCLTNLLRVTDPRSVEFKQILCKNHYCPDISS